MQETRCSEIASCVLHLVSEEKMKHAIIVAGGVGKRMNAELPKQFMQINGKPILMHTIQAFYNYNSSINIIVVLPKNQHEYWAEQIDKHQFTIPHKLAEGGKERFFSVKNALNLINTDGLIAVHDGVRPLISQQTIANCFTSAEKVGSAIPVVPISSSVRYIDGEQSKSVDRTKYVEVQTPQVFKSEWIKKAYNQPFSTHFTDDASVVEECGYKVSLVEGNVENIKITYPKDTLIAEVLLKGISKNSKI